ncbi:phosphotransferase [Sulfurimonas sp. HSL-3221]|uniref:aminoglycoside phosphotransferase family protein n=2 Tax=Sulfurimonadaceae TaxID=2771471 RepID=UPI001E42AA2A|nr:phosphotransferase [Sulfurimonas sp. HSL-3221]UFS61785.1 phosphotransferase [Sulfurimonas sp. HSL-3221]
MHKVKAWLAKTPYRDWEVEVASADASFRRYFRLRRGREKLIVMDASLEKESLAPFLDVTGRLLGVDVKAPQVYLEDRAEGFLVLEDFGSRSLLNVLNEANFDSYYSSAIDEIVKMQAADAEGLPLYDKPFLHFEMDLMKTWFLEKYLGMTLSEEEERMLAEVLDTISETVLSQPQGVFVHRDFHSRNIMVTPSDETGVIDYQDAMKGAVTYDLVSLLKDLYIRFEPEEMAALALRFRDRAGIVADDATFLKWFDFMGLQRHIKVLGIFARLWLRDGKPGYLGDLPLTLRYTIEAANRYEETKPLAALLERVTLPPLPAKGEAQ